MVTLYRSPCNWIACDLPAVIGELAEAKASILAFGKLPFQRSWAEKLSEMELKREVAGTSRIEGASFTDREYEEAVGCNTPETDLTRSQKQARAAMNTYRWIAQLPTDRPVDVDLIKEIHRRIVTGCDDDHCPPGQLRGAGQNVTFGHPRHRGVEGGRDCEVALQQLLSAASREFELHDSLIQALALHYHIGAMHPFLDGNGRTARALEALLLRRARLSDTLFISMSNYYYEEKNQYLACLSETRLGNHDLTPFIRFGLRGIAAQCQRMLREIEVQLQKSLFRDVMNQMYGRLRSKRKRALAHRQCEILNLLLDLGAETGVSELFRQLQTHYGSLKNPMSAFARDLGHLAGLNAIALRREALGHAKIERLFIQVRLEWATEITETEFFSQINRLPHEKTRLVSVI